MKTLAFFEVTNSESPSWNGKIILDADNGVFKVHWRRKRLFGYSYDPLGKTETIQEAADVFLLQHNFDQLAPSS